MIELVDLFLADALDVEGGQDVHEVLAMQIVELDPRTPPCPHLLHGWLVACPPRVGKGVAVALDAAHTEKRSDLACDALAPVDDGTEHVEAQSAYLQGCGHSVFLASCSAGPVGIVAMPPSDSRISASCGSRSCNIPSGFKLR